MASLGGMDAVTRQSNILPTPVPWARSVTSCLDSHSCDVSGRVAAQLTHFSSNSNAITATNFEPTPVAPPRAWQRVAVPSAGHTRQRKIWKRVGAVPTNTLPNSYVAAMAELESQGDVARKRSRPAQYIPVFGDAEWAPAVQRHHRNVNRDRK